jgi:hypothetical protein
VGRVPVDEAESAIISISGHMWGQPTQLVSAAADGLSRNMSRLLNKTCFVALDMLEMTFVIDVGNVSHASCETWSIHSCWRFMMNSPQTLVLRSIASLEIFGNWLSLL